MLEQMDDLALPNWDPQWPQVLWPATLGQAGLCDCLVG